MGLLVFKRVLKRMRTEKKVREERGEIDTYVFVHLSKQRDIPAEEEKTVAHHTQA